MRSLRCVALLIAASLLISASPAATPDEPDLRLQAFYEPYYRDLLRDYRVPPTEYWGDVVHLHAEYAELLRDRIGFAELSVLADRLASAIMSVASADPGRALDTLLGIVGAADQMDGVLRDLGLDDRDAAREWLYTRSGWIAWLASVRGNADALRQLSRVETFREVTEFASGAALASRPDQLVDLQLFALGTLDVALDRTLGAQARESLDRDRTRALVNAHQLGVARMLEELHGKAADRRLDVVEAMALIDLEAHYHALRSDAHALDIAYWEEELDPDTGTIPFTDSTLMDLFPGYDDADSERERLATARQLQVDATTRVDTRQHLARIFAGEVRRLAEAAEAAAAERAREDAASAARIRESYGLALISNARRGDLERVEELLAEGAPTDLLDPHGETALIAACQVGQEAIVQRLLEAGADPDQPSAGGWPPLLSCSTSAILDDLLDHGAAATATGPDGENALSRLLRLRARTTASRDPVPEHLEALAVRLVRGGLDVDRPDAEGRTPLLRAVGADGSGGVPGHVDLLLRLSADPTIPDGAGRTPLMLAAYAGELEIVDMLLAADCSPRTADRRRRTALMYAAAPGPVSYNVDVLARLLAAGADVDARDRAGQTALHYAVRRCRDDEAELLLDRGADPLRRDALGRTAFDLEPALAERLFELDGELTAWPETADCYDTATLLADLPERQEWLLGQANGTPQSPGRPLPSTSSDDDGDGRSRRRSGSPPTAAETLTRDDPGEEIGGAIRDLLSTPTSLPEAARRELDRLEMESFELDDGGALQPLASAVADDPAAALEALGHGLGRVSAHSGPQSWTVHVPADYETVEVGLVAAGSDEVTMYAGWASELRVNDRTAWRHDRHDSDRGGIFLDFVHGGEALEVEGLGRWFDVTPLIHAGDNTVEYVHHSAGVEFDVRLRVRRRAPPPSAGATADEPAASPGTDMGSAAGPPDRDHFADSVWRWTGEETRYLLLRDGGMGWATADTPDGPWNGAGSQTLRSDWRLREENGVHRLIVYTRVRDTYYGVVSPRTVSYGWPVREARPRVLTGEDGRLELVRHEH